MPDTLESLIQKATDAIARKASDKIIEICTHIISHADANDEQKVKAYLNIGVAYNSKGERDRAIQNFDKTIKMNPNYAEAYCNRGIAYGEKNEYDRAIQDLDKAVELRSNYAEAYYSRGITYSRKGEYDRAIQDCDKAIKIKPNYVEAYVNRGNVYNSKGEHDRAIQDFDKAIEIKPDHTTAIHNRGVAMALKMSEEARKKVSDKYDSDLKERMEKLDKLAAHDEHMLDEYLNREKEYKEKKEATENRRSGFLILLSILAPLSYPAVAYAYFRFFPPTEFSGFFALLPLVVATTLMLSPIIWFIRILNRRIEKLWALEEHSYSNYQLISQLLTAKDNDPDIKKELLKKFFDHHDKRGSSQLIADWDRTTEKDSNDNIIQTITNRTPKEKE